VAERNGLLNRRTGYTVPWVRIPPSPQNKHIAPHSRGIFVSDSAANLFAKAKGRKNERHQRCRQCVCFDAPTSGIAAGNPTLSADRILSVGNQCFPKIQPRIRNKSRNKQENMEQKLTIAGTFTVPAISISDPKDWFVYFRFTHHGKEYL
jgi:hypothetical protein